MVLNLQGDECWFQGPFRRGAINTEVDISELRERFLCEVAATPGSIQNQVFRAFLCLIQLLVPGEQDRLDNIGAIDSSKQFCW